MAKLLIVDDEIEICDFLKAFFEDRDFHVVTALSGEEALILVEAENPHIVLLDLRMPGMNGLETLKQIKERYPHVRVIIVTAIETQNELDEALR
ncbi:MAG: response regulator, partial [Candidatus Omnitrophica bacterium]|nr:response regulator [Candidatus Omnitrophota bacterium]